MSSQSRRAVIFGISGQDGAYLARFLLDKGYQVFGTSRDCEMNRFDNLRRLRIADRVELASVALTDARNVFEVIDDAQAHEVYNLSGQSSVGLSFCQPLETLNSHLVGTVNLLEAIRQIGRECRFYNASSGESFGDTPPEGSDENVQFRPCSPYGVGKAAARWMVSNYRTAHGLFACSGIMFNHESPLRPRRFVTSKIVHGAIDIWQKRTQFLTLGNLDVARDWGWAPEYVEAMWRIISHHQPEDFVIATGESHTLREFVETAFACLGLDWHEHVRTDEKLLRPTDIRYSVGRADKARRVLGWQARTRMTGIVKAMIAAELEVRGLEGPVTGKTVDDQT